MDEKYTYWWEGDNLILVDGHCGGWHQWGGYTAKGRGTKHNVTRHAIPHGTVSNTYNGTHQWEYPGGHIIKIDLPFHALLEAMREPLYQKSLREEKLKRIIR